MTFECEKGEKTVWRIEKWLLAVFPFSALRYVVSFRNPLSAGKILILSKLKVFVDNPLNAKSKHQIYHSEGEKKLCGKKTKILVTRISSFSHNVFKRLFSLVHQKWLLFGKELKTNLLFWSCKVFFCLFITLQPLFPL